MEDISGLFADKLSLGRGYNCIIRATALIRGLSLHSKAAAGAEQLLRRAIKAQGPRPKARAQRLAAARAEPSFELQTQLQLVKRDLYFLMRTFLGFAVILFSFWFFFCFVEPDFDAGSDNWPLCARGATLRARRAML